MEDYLLLSSKVGSELNICLRYVYFNRYIINEILENKNSDAISILTEAQGKRFHGFKFNLLI